MYNERVYVGSTCRCRMRSVCLCRAAMVLEPSQCTTWLRENGMKITKSQLKQIIKEEMETALNNPRTDELKAALEVSYDTNLDPQEAAADILTVVEEFLSDKLGMPIELRY